MDRGTRARFTPFSFECALSLGVSGLECRGCGAERTECEHIVERIVLSTGAVRNIYSFYKNNVHSSFHGCFVHIGLLPLGSLSKGTRRPQVLPIGDMGTEVSQCLICYQVFFIGTLCVCGLPESFFHGSKWCSHIPTLYNDDTNTSMPTGK